MQDTGANIPDPLRYNIPLPIEATLYPLGFPLNLRTNSPAVFAAATTIWDPFTPAFAADPIELRIAVTNETVARPDPAPLPFGQAHLVNVIHSASEFATADLDRGFIYAWLTAATAEDQGYLLYHFLEPLVYLTLTSLHLVPVHAACVALNGKAVLLCGESGAGKTSLSYALAKLGWTYLADDATYLIRGHHSRVLGKPYQIRFRASAKLLFPELEPYQVVRRPNGKPDLEISTATLGLTNIAQHARPELLIFLRRETEAVARLHPVAPSAIIASLEQVLCFGTPEVRRQQRETLQDLLLLPAFEMVYSNPSDVDRILRTCI